MTAYNVARGTLALGAALAAAAALWAAVTASAATGPIRVTATLTHSVGRDRPPVGRAGDAVEQAWRITDRHGNTIGRMLARCVWIVQGGRLCDGELEMPTGKLAFTGSSVTPFEGEYAVTGGTGQYRAGGGVMLFTAIGIRKTVLLVTVER